MKNRKRQFPADKTLHLSQFNCAFVEKCVPLQFELVSLIHSIHQFRFLIHSKIYVFVRDPFSIKKQLFLVLFLKNGISNKTTSMFPRFWAKRNPYRGLTHCAKSVVASTPRKVFILIELKSMFCTGLISGVHYLILDPIVCVVRVYQSS